MNFSSYMNFSDFFYFLIIYLMPQISKRKPHCDISWHGKQYHVAASVAHGGAYEAHETACQHVGTYVTCYLSLKLH